MRNFKNDANAYLGTAQPFLMRYIILLLALCQNNTIDAEPISTWTDKDGVRHFSSTPKKDSGLENIDPPSAQSVDQSSKHSIELPAIKKYDIDYRIKNVQSETPETCLNHGGINCEAGIDKDGSVICHDGSLESLERYDTSCTEVRLISSFKNSRAGANKRLWSVPIVVQVRNETGIEATNVRVKVSYPENINSDERKELYLEGPTKIPSYGTSDYTYSGKLIDSRIANKANITVYCKNCWDPEKSSASPSPANSINFK